MLYGLYLSAQGAEVQSLRQDVVANNLANASTNGFKRQLALFQSHDLFDQTEGHHEVPEALEGQTGGVTAAAIVTDYSQGALQTTSSPFDVALSGEGFLQVQGGDQNYLTRDGRLAMSDNGQLITRDQGHLVLDVGGQPIQIDLTAGPITIQADGTVQQGSPPNAIGKIGVYQTADPQALERLGENLYRSPADTQPIIVGTTTQIRQGMLETSGTRPMLEMLDLIQSSRQFEMNTTMIQHQDESLSRLLSSLPRK